MTDLSTDQTTGNQTTGVGRRAVLGGAAALAALGPLQALGARTAGAAPMKKQPFSPDYGPLAPVDDQATGLPLLMLPAGFEYISYGWTGDTMDDGKPTPAAHDGMATFPAGRRGIPPGRGNGKGDDVALVRNHEQGSFRPAFTEPAYDPNANGGTTNMLFDPRAGQWLSSSASLSGTIRNCAGGTTPQGSWLTCEETTATSPAGTPHGYIFEVPSGGLGDPEPYKFMGRFSHEAVCVDPSTGIVYETEDATPSGFYRFLPNNPTSLAAGGRLQMMVVEGSAPGVSAQTYTDPTGTEYFTSWVDIDQPDPPAGTPSTVQQGIARGGAQFARLEGAWWSEGKAYIVSTSGGPIRSGQVFEYDPGTETMRVLFASTNRAELASPDNICVSPRDGVVLCQDGGNEPQRMFGLTLDGAIFDFARNNVVLDGPFKGKSVEPGDYREMEWCGSTFDTRGDWLFANIQNPGITFAITGPWKDGSL